MINKLTQPSIIQIVCSFYVHIDLTIKGFDSELFEDDSELFEDLICSSRRPPNNHKPLKATVFLSS